jgi:hypothetical protein
MPWVHRAGGERSWSLCGPSAAKLEAIAAVVRTVITVMTAITVKKSAAMGSAAGQIRQTGTGE